MKRKVSIMLLLMLTLILVGCGNSVVKKSIEQAKTSIESKEYDKALASLQLALDEDKENEEANKLYSIVDGYQKAKKLVDENKIAEAKEIIDGINSDYINYVIKDDIDNLKSQINNYLKEVENITALLNEAENMLNNKQYAECKSHINDKILASQYVTDEQKVKADELVKKSDEAINEIEAQRIAEEKKNQQSLEKRYYVPHLNKSLTMDEMFNEYNKTAIPFDYVDNGNTYIFNPGSAKPTEPAY
ncbi:hypothetical protein PMW00_12610 [Clostridium paraputrificum]|uniref:hypothetical protein n=1 Tax=Clostridium TaxID=1485 RepID=UPI0012B837CB|nr:MULTISPECIES: hypothetical protein [Clostridium]MBS6889124.1 hypothetical protein [Clostridium sp.]MDB2103860.1 hypothetical protein [Clostridium paraputrificum]